MRFSSLSDWLAWQETLHPVEIDLGLERVNSVLQRMGLQQPSYAVITVGGTNGKGSCVAILEAILGAAGYRVGAYTSPHLLRYNERVRVDHATASDEALCEAFARVDAARGGTSLTYFEFGTLAALEIFSRADLDVAILEVGMGGRLDAVNGVDADVAVVTTVAIDHVAWLGPDRESIGAEKAGIFRAGQPAVYGDADPPHSVVARARTLNTPLSCLGRDFGFARMEQSWSWWGKGSRHDCLPLPQLRGPYQLKNAATALMALTLLKARLPVTDQAIHAGLREVTLPGRLQVLDERGLRLCDVAHNPQAAGSLADAVRAMPCAGETHAVLAMLADKDVAGVVSALADTVKIWHVAGLDCARGAAAGWLAEQVQAALPGAGVRTYPDVSAAMVGAAAAGPADRILVFGSFYTVAAALQACNDGVWQRTGSEAMTR